MNNPSTGWKRVWIVLCCGWGIWIAVAASIEWKAPKGGAYIYYGIPPGTSFTEDSVTFPDGRTFKLQTQDWRTGKDPGPWNIDWSKEPQVPKVRGINWFSIAANMLVVPAFFLLVIWSLTKIGKWIYAGFNIPAGS